VVTTAYRPYCVPSKLLGGRRGCRLLFTRHPLCQFLRVIRGRCRNCIPAASTAPLRRARHRWLSYTPCCPLDSCFSTVRYYAWKLREHSKLNIGQSSIPLLELGLLLLLPIKPVLRTLKILKGRLPPMPCVLQKYFDMDHTTGGRETIKPQREIVQIVTPGTLRGDLQTDTGRPNYLLAITRHPRQSGFVFVWGGPGAFIIKDLPSHFDYFDCSFSYCPFVQNYWTGLGRYFHGGGPCFLFI
jgi:hypothetical protein